MKDGATRSRHCRFASRTAFACLVATLAGGCYRQYFRGPPETCHDVECDQAKACRDMQNLQKAVEIYRTVHGQLPSNELGLHALVEDQILLGIPKDPWGHPYVYGEAAGHAFVSSLGADGKLGGEGADQDLVDP